MSLGATRAILARHALQLRRERGQNFLVDPAWAQRLAERAGIGPDDVVVEIGTGLGALTRALAERAARVVSLEIDAGIVRALREESLLPDAVELHHVDARRVDLAALAGSAPRERRRLVANLPYSAATPLLRRLLDARTAFADWSVMVQRELADRLVATPGSKDYGSLSVLHALTAHVEHALDVPPGVFFPVPKVMSSFVRVVPRSDAAIDADELRRIERVARAAFGQRRKTLANALAGGGFARPAVAAALERAGIEARARAETLAPERFRALAALLPQPAGG